MEKIWSDISGQQLISQTDFKAKKNRHSRHSAANQWSLFVSMATVDGPQCSGNKDKIN